MANDKTTQSTPRGPRAKQPDKVSEIKIATVGQDEPPTEDIASEVIELQAAEIAELKNRVLSALADMENLRRRTEREISDARKYAVANFAREMLMVSDNLRRAIDAVPAEARGGEDIGVLIEGVEVTERGLEQAMNKFGVTAIETRGRKFDPSLHQAMMEVEDETGVPGNVAEEIQIGYVIGDRVLRPAFVSVFKKVRAKPAEAAGSDVAEETSDS
jgi:molecular chaperone GrpE